MIGVVVPVCNRLENLQLLLLSLERQTCDDFVVVVADDGSADGTRSFVEEQADSDEWRSRLRWIGCGPDHGVRTGRARNIGAANLPDAARHLLMLDSDLVLQPRAIELTLDAARNSPDLVLLGAVEWLPPMDHETVRQHLRDQDIDALRAEVPEGRPQRVEGTFVGRELREQLRLGDVPEEFILRPEWALPLNSTWPLDRYWAIGGFDEGMVGYGYQDMELGARAAKAGTVARYLSDLWALHVWHPKPPRAMIENQRNLDYFLRRHGPNPLVETDIDWGIWWHYHAERGGTIAHDTDGTLWAVNRDRTHALQFPDASWIRRLGAEKDDVMDGLDLSRIQEASWSAPQEH
ncbi:hypothetical protein GCM10027059_37690 [Myceligenerans halotolerans]